MQLRHLGFKCRCLLSSTVRSTLPKSMSSICLYSNVPLKSDYFIYGEYLRLHVLLPEEGVRI